MELISNLHLEHNSYVLGYLILISSPPDLHNHTHILTYTIYILIHTLTHIPTHTNTDTKTYSDTQALIHTNTYTH